MTTRLPQTIIRCDYVAEYPSGPHPGCAEFDGGATFEVRCPAAATHLTEITDEMAAQVLGDGDDTLLLCDEHHSDLLHDVATGGTYLSIRHDGPVPQDATTDTNRAPRGIASGKLRGTGTRPVRPVLATASSAFTTIPRQVPRLGRDAHLYERDARRSHAMILDVIEYGRGEYDGLVTVRVVLAGNPEAPRTTEVLAEDIFASDHPLRASHAAGVWARDKYHADA